MLTIPTIEPSVVTAGDTIQWQPQYPDYPASAGWLIKYSLRGPAVIDITSDATQLITVLPASSTSWLAGDYAIQGYAVLGTERHTVYTGTVTIKPNLAALTGTYDGRSHAKRTLDAIEATIEGRATKSDLEIIIDGTRISRMPHEQLIRLRSYYRNEYQAEQRRADVQNGKGSGRRVLVRFRS